MLCIGIALLFGIGLLIAKWYIEIPDFLVSIKEQMIKNPAFISKIGECRGWTIWFDKELAANKGKVPFSISINGKNDSVYVRIVGTYVLRRGGKIEYTKKDTVFSKQACYVK
ncbi:MAG: hypothetical protein ACRYFZ_15305 [Janthinobacterium lividum]